MLVQSSCLSLQLALASQSSSRHWVSWPTATLRLQARAWRNERRWVALWAAVAALTLLHTATLVFALGASALAVACAALFAWTALLGCGGAARGLSAAGPAHACAPAGAFAANLRVRPGLRAARTACAPVRPAPCAR